MKRVVVGLSGGVDSSVAAYILKEQGYEVVGLFMRNWHDTTGTLDGDCPWEDDRMFAELVAKKLDIPFHYIDLSDQYRARVVDYMFAEYEKGRTPNPDVPCTRIVYAICFLYLPLSSRISPVSDIWVQILYGICNSISCVLNFYCPSWTALLWFLDAVGKPASIIPNGGFLSLLRIGIAFFEPRA